MRSRYCVHLLALGSLLVLSSALAAQDQTASRPVRFMLHGNMSHEPPTEEYLRFVEQIKPDILIMGVFDQRLYALAAPAPGSKKTASPDELLAQWKRVADRLHRNGIRLIGQMELFVVSDRPQELPQGIGWFGFYDKAWDEKRLGLKPTRTAVELLERPDLDAHRKPGDRPPVPEGDAVALCGCRVNTRALRGCVNNPSWRVVQKRMVRAAVEVGVDGFMTNRNYFEHCACEHCRRNFRTWLGEHYSTAELQGRFGIGDLTKHELTCVVGTHRAHDTVPRPLVLEKIRFARHAIKDFVDDVYVRYGRSLRKELFVAQWNHSAYFDELHLDRGHLPLSTRTSLAHALADERWSLPPPLWGWNEDLIWYCNWGISQKTILAKQYAGDTTLYGKYVRAMAAGKACVLNKYDFYRPRVTIAEAAALGYATNAVATPWQTEEDRTVVSRYFAFLRTHEALYRQADSFAEIGLVFPRRAVHAGDASALEYVEAAGRAMVCDHVLFDMLPDDLLTRLPLERYRAVALAAPEYLEVAERTALARYVERGGKVLWMPVSPADRERPGAAVEEARRRIAKASPFAITRVEGARTERDRFLKEMYQAVGGVEQLSRFEAPWTVEAHAYRQPANRRLLVHLVNYNHREDAPGKSVVEREAPLAADPVPVRLQLPQGMTVRSLRFLSPDDGQERPVEFRQRGRSLEFTTPRFLVYGVCVVEE